QCLVQQKAKTLEVRLEGAPGPWVGAKDFALALIGRHGTGFAAGHAIEYRGGAVEAMSMAARTTPRNTSIAAGARIGMGAPDATTFAWLRGRPYAPSGAMWYRAVDYWRSLASDADAAYDRSLTLDVTDLAPQVTWGTSPQDALAIDARVPHPDDAADEGEAQR